MPNSEVLDYLKTRATNNGSQFGLRVVEKVRSEIDGGYLQINVFGSLADGALNDHGRTVGGKYLGWGWRSARAYFDSTGLLYVRTPHPKNPTHATFHDGLFTLMHELSHHFWGASEVRATEFQKNAARAFALDGVSPAKRAFIDDMQKTAFLEETARAAYHREDPPGSDHHAQLEGLSQRVTTRSRRSCLTGPDVRGATGGFRLPDRRGAWWGRTFQRMQAFGGRARTEGLAAGQAALILAAPALLELCVDEFAPETKRWIMRQQQTVGVYTDSLAKEIVAIPGKWVDAPVTTFGNGLFALAAQANAACGSINPFLSQSAADRYKCTAGWMSAEEYWARHDK